MAFGNSIESIGSRADTYGMPTKLAMNYLFCMSCNWLFVNSLFHTRYNEIFLGNSTTLTNSSKGYFRGWIIKFSLKEAGLTFPSLEVNLLWQQYCRAPNVLLTHLDHLLSNTLPPMFYGYTNTATRFSTKDYSIWCWDSRNCCKS